MSSLRRKSGKYRAKTIKLPLMSTKHSELVWLHRASEIYNCTYKTTELLRPHSFASREWFGVQRPGHTRVNFVSLSSMRFHLYYYSTNGLMATISVAGCMRYTKPFPIYSQNLICFMQDGK